MASALQNISHIGLHVHANIVGSVYIIAGIWTELYPRVFKNLL